MYLLAFCLAVLPPFYQSTREIQTILSDPRLSASLGSAEPIMEINRTETGYEVLTLHYRLEIDRVYKPQPMPGPAHFELEFHGVEARTGNN